MYIFVSEVYIWQNTSLHSKCCRHRLLFLIKPSQSNMLLPFPIMITKNFLRQKIELLLNIFNWKEGKRAFSEEGYVRMNWWWWGLTGLVTSSIYFSCLLWKSNKILSKRFIWKGGHSFLRWWGVGVFPILKSWGLIVSGSHSS